MKILNSALYTLEIIENITKFKTVRKNDLYNLKFSKMYHNFELFENKK